MKHFYSDRAANGDSREFFRHDDGRCVVALNARVGSAGGEDVGESRYAIIEIDGLKVNGRDATDAEADELTDVVIDELRQFDWELPMRGRGLL